MRGGESSPAWRDFEEVSPSVGELHINLCVQLLVELVQELVWQLVRVIVTNACYHCLHRSVGSCHSDVVDELV